MSVRWRLDHRLPLLGRTTSTVRSALRPAVYAGAAREVALSAFHLATYPLGMLPPWPSRIETPHAGIGADPADLQCTDMPVVLVHGYVHNRSAFLVMARSLRRAGFRSVHTFEYNPLTADLDAIAEDLAVFVERLLRTSATSRCMVVGHSMGGVVARHYVQQLGGDEHVETVLTLGSPHRGTYSSYLGLGPAAAQLRPGSAYLRRMEETARPGHVRWIAYYCDLDVMVTPAANARLVHPALRAINVRIRDTGHLSLLLSGQVLRGVVDHLSASAVADGAAATT